GDDYFICISRDRQPQDVLVGPQFQIIQSGDPDLVVQPLSLTPFNGSTRVAVLIRNLGYASAGPSHGLLTFSNYPTPSILNQAGIGPFGSITYTAVWHPDDPSNTVTFSADYDQKITEINENNNQQSVALSTVDKHIPSITIGLANPALTADPAPRTWGRYVA